MTGERARWRESPTRGWRISAGAAPKPAAWHPVRRPTAVGRPGGGAGVGAAVAAVGGDGGDGDEEDRRGDGDAGAAGAGAAGVSPRRSAAGAGAVAAGDEGDGDVPSGAPRSIGWCSSVAVV